MDDLAHTVWCKSSHSGSPYVECVEVTNLPDGCWAIRDSKNAAGHKLRFTSAAWSIFVTGARDGEFDGSHDHYPGSRLDLRKRPGC